MDSLTEEKRQKRLLRKRAYYAANRERLREAQKISRSANREKLREANAIYYARNSEKHKQRVADWEMRNSDKVKALRKEWAKNNAAKCLANAVKFKASKLRSMPAWADEFVINEIYELSSLRTKATGVKHNVDHVVPLKSDLVCGLHCESNLQVIPEILNIKKSNRHWPDMPK